MYFLFFYLFIYFFYLFIFFFRGKKSLQPSSLTRPSSARARKLSVSQEEKELSGALMQLKSIYGESTTLKPVSCPSPITDSE